MTATLLDGKRIAMQIREEVKNSVSHRAQAQRATPTLAAVLVGDDPASHVYVRNKERACEKAGIESRLIRMDTATTTEQLLATINELNSDLSVNGILVQLPLPDAIDETKVLDAIDPLKDVDAFHPANVGLMCQGRPRFLPCTPHGIVQLLSRYELPTRGKNVVIIGRSDIVGKPMAMMLAQRDSSCGPDYANATVAIAHRETRDLADLTQSADILIAAIGRPKFVTGEMVRPGAVVVDVGINRTDEGLVGDVDFEAVSEIALAITPVPGGVGPLTVAMLLHNTLHAADLQHPSSV